MISFVKKFISYIKKRKSKKIVYKEAVSAYYDEIKLLSAQCDEIIKSGGPRSDWFLNKDDFIKEYISINYPGFNKL